MTAKRVYFFKGSEYVRFDSASNAVPLGYPLSISRWWGGLPDNINAAFCRGKGRAYFFAADQYYRYTVVANTVDAGYPRPIAGNWPGMTEAGFDRDLDAAVNWGNGKVYFFKGANYLRYDLPADKVDPDYPKPITGNWPGVGGGFETGIDAAINYGNGKVYFFKGANYLRIDLGTKNVDAGYPKPIAGNWPGVYDSGMDAALEWPFAELAPGGFKVPIGRSGCVKVPVGGGRTRGGEQFRMELDFQETVHPMSCAVGEYRQSARGSIVINGAAIAFPLPNPAGGPPVTLLPRPAAGAVGDNFIQDGLTPIPPGANEFYGHRIAAAGNADGSDRFLPNRMEGCQYRGTDFPGYAGVAGETFAFDVDFKGDALDAASSEIIQTTMWTFNCSGTL